MNCSSSVGWRMGSPAFVSHSLLEHLARKLIYPWNRLVAMLSLMLMFWGVALLWGSSNMEEDSQEGPSPDVSTLPDPGAGLIEMDKPSPTRHESFNSEKSPE